jgi:hypothetical protein
MKHSTVSLVIASLVAPAAALAGNCGNGQGGGVGNPHCGHGPVVPQTQQAGIQINQNNNPPTQVGGIVPDPHNTVLTPQKPPAQQVPTPIAVVVPPQVLPPQQTPMLVPPKPPAQQIPVPPSGQKPPVVLTPQPQVPVITYNPPQPPVLKAPEQQVTLLPSGGNILENPRPVHGNALLVHAPERLGAVTSGRVAVAPSVYTFEFIEPGLQNRKVKVFRTNDAAEQVYKDTIPLDQGGFRIIVVGTRNPDYVH